MPPSPNSSRVSFSAKEGDNVGHLAAVILRKIDPGEHRRHGVAHPLLMAFSRPGETCEQ